MTTTPLSHKALTAHLRDRIRHAGISAGVRMQDHDSIDIYPKGGPYARFTRAEQITLGVIGEVNGLTFVRGTAIDTTHDVRGHGMKFSWSA